ncbi:lysine--tRNA ligase [candidate division WS5 bacterium]|uniref:Lysine--tRNA ligase n=1 Tax=candidate division WS5 bacterium TaxID=2093353 RepID=A0A419DA14_9BACT|nr:MAG: lysine--tRNA ligase [candidate division WS5 bacterium]
MKKIYLALVLSYNLLEKRGIQMAEDIFINQRKENLKKLVEAGVDPYPAKGERSHLCAQIKDDFKKLEGKKVTVVGRVMTKRGHGKILFANIQDVSGQTQGFFRFDNLKNNYDLLKYVDMGDFIQITGKVFKTKAGEESVEVMDWKFLSKAMKPLPEKWHGLKDVETRYRKRYLDFLTNEESKNVIRTKARIIQFLRKFLSEEGFEEVFTPYLELNPSGAAAKPFKTHLNAYNMDMYMRICIGELWQKMMIVGGFEKTFEIGQAFRNEGVDKAHNPEFTMCEFYWAYADRDEQIKITEKLFSRLVKEISGSYGLAYQGEKLNFKPPFPVITFKEVMQKYAKLDIDKYPTLEALTGELKKRKFQVDPKAGRGKLIDDYYKAEARPKLIQPTFLINHPIEISPLAKKNEKDPSTVQRLQLLVCGEEMCNGYSELNDPEDQKSRFTEQKKLLKKGDEEAMRSDEHFVEALEYGMPPVAGNGIGIERLTMLLTDSQVMREVITFPIMKPEK